MTASLVLLIVVAWVSPGHVEDIPTPKSMIQISVEGMKLPGLLSGGAAVALLPYLASLAGKGPTSRGLGVATLCYLIGLVLCAATFAMSYLTPSACTLINR
jgi:hypothetical protein